MDWPRRWLARLGKLGIVLVVLAVVLTTGFFASLPEIVRQVVVRQVPKTIGRQISIEDIDLNLFTGYIAVKKLRLTERDGRAAFVEFERLEARLALWGIVGRNIRVRDFRLVGPVVRIVRGENGELNFQDLMPGVEKADVAREPTKWAFMLDHAAIERGRLVVEDRAVSPPADWSIQDLTIETSGVSTRPNSPPGRLRGSLRMGTTALDIRWDKFQQAPVRVEGVVKLTGFDLTRVRPYLPPPIAGAFASGTLRTELSVAYTRTVEGIQAAQASGEAAVESVGLVNAGTKDPLLAMGRLGVGLKRFDLEGRDVTLSSVELTGFDAQIRRDKSGQIDLLAPFSKPGGEAPAPKAESAPAPVAPAAAQGEPAPKPSPKPWPKPWKVRVERVKIDGAKVAFTDESVAPAVRFAAVLGTELGVEYVPTAEGVPTVLASGDVTVSNIALERPGTKETLVALARLGVGLKRFDLAGQEVTLSRVDLAGLEARLRRDKSGQIDVLAIATGASATGEGRGGAPPPKVEPARAPTAPSTSRREPAPKPWQVGVERTRLGAAKVVFTDETVDPAVQLNVSNLNVGVDNLTWPVRGPASLTLSASLPGNGTLKVQGPVTLQPFDAQLTMAIRDAAIEPYQSYMPVPARFSGRFNGDSKNRIAMKDGKTTIASKGTSWADKFEAKLPGAEAPLITIERMDLVDIDFDWPTKAIVGKAGFKRMSVEIERAEDGSFDIVKAFGGPAAPAAPEAKDASAAAATKPAPPASAPTSPAAPASGAKPKGLLETMELRFGEIRLEEGSLRFIDRGTEPDFSEDFSKMDLTVTDLGNKPAQKAKLVFTTVVGGDGGLEIRGDIGAVGAPLYLDLAGEIRDLNLPAVNPYSDKAIAWLIKQGDLKYKFTVKVENDQLTATNQVVVSKLRIAKAKQVDDQVKSRLGLPLGLIVALIKDANGNIVLNVPISGSLKDPNFDLSDAIWSSIKNVLVNVLASPFRLIGSLFSKGDKIEEPKVNPVTFPAGSLVLTPSMEEHLLRVADFMRRTPYVTLTMHPVVASADLEALKSTEVAARLQQFAKEKGISDPPKILAAYFKEKMPDEKPPPTVEEQLKRLREREPVPEAKVKEMREQRVAVTKERLVKKEGIQDKRLIPGEADKPPAGSTEGMVEFTVGGSEE
jgi:uncharacterized protein involved in outer membrane biogenesis